MDIINSTLGKALGGAAGGYTSGSQHLIDLLRQRARPYLFSNSIPPAVVACADQVGTEKKNVNRLFGHFEKTTELSIDKKKLKKNFWEKISYNHSKPITKLL